MNQSIGFFDEVARVGRDILAVLAGRPASDHVKEYLEHVADIYRLLGAIHHEVARVAAKTSLAANIDEAKEALKGIERVSLERTFRARHWCDELEKLGYALHPLSEDVGMSEDDRKIWDEFCQKLEWRETEVAYLYDEKLHDFRQLAYSDLPLESLKNKAEDISGKLTTQKARFDQLAREAEAMRERLG